MLCSFAGGAGAAAARREAAAAAALDGGYDGSAGCTATSAVQPATGMMPAGFEQQHEQQQQQQHAQWTG
jgi:hypothetical protein